jgi:hypothetical protein
MSFGGQLCPPCCGARSSHARRTIVRSNNHRANRACHDAVKAALARGHHGQRVTQETAPGGGQPITCRPDPSGVRSPWSISALDVRSGNRFARAQCRSSQYDRHAAEGFLPRPKQYQDSRRPAREVTTGQWRSKKKAPGRGQGFSERETGHTPAKEETPRQGQRRPMGERCLQAIAFPSRARIT